MIAVFAANFALTLGATSAWAMQRARTNRAEQHVEHLTNEVDQLNHQLILARLEAEL